MGAGAAHLRRSALADVADAPRGRAADLRRRRAVHDLHAAVTGLAQPPHRRGCEARLLVQAPHAPRPGAHAEPPSPPTAGLLGACPLPRW